MFTPLPNFQKLKLISISIKGFGDLVPGLKKNDKLSNAKLVMTSMNCLFGMAVVGMCFSMMQRVARRYLARLVVSIKKLISCTVCCCKDPASSLVQLEDEKEIILNRIRMLKQYDELLNLKRRRATASTS